MKAMILAAGRGERMRPLTDIVPKTLLKVNDKPLIIYHIEKLKKIGITDIVINLAWLGEKIKDTLGDGSSYGVSIHYSLEIEGGLETAGGIRHAINLLGNEPFVVLNGDIFTDFDYSNFLNEKLDENSFGYLYLVENPDHNKLGDFSFEGDLLRTTPKYTFSGMAIYSPKAFCNMPDKRAKLKPFFDQWISQNKLKGKVINDYWCDVGTPERLNVLDLKLRNCDSL